MSDEVPPPGEFPPPPERPHPPEPNILPGWVPVLIGVILVTMAGLAVFTGLRRYTDNAFTTFRSRTRSAPQRQANTAAPPGEPQPGASLVFPGDAGDNAPVANPPSPNRARAEITGGGAGGVSSVVHLWAKRGMMTSVVPGDAVVYVNDLAIGEARQFNSQDEIYDFAAPGSYTVRFVAPGYKELTFVVTASDGAPKEIAKIEAKLVKE